MIAPQIPANESERLHELYKYELLDTVYEEEFDEIVKLASEICKVPISLISLVDMNRQWFKARTGLDASETARNVSFCSHAIHTNDLFEVSDAAADDRFHDNPLVIGNPNIRFYGGMPLITKSGYKIGTLCVIDRKPRQLNAEQVFAMKVLSRQVVKLMELRIRNKELKKITDVQQRIITILAHDIRGPLATLKTTYEFKNAGYLSPEQSKEIDDMVPRQLDSTIHMLNNIVDWGKLQLSEVLPQDNVFNLHELCSNCFDYLQLSAKEKNNHLINKISASLSIHGNKDALEFILRNLLGNANKFTEGGEIAVSAIVTGMSLDIVVADTGVGMTEDAKKSLMDRTWSATKHGTRREKGSGMGLKLIFEYLENINGNIRFDSEAGKGTTITVTLPFTY